MSPVQIDVDAQRCGAEKHKGDPRTLDAYVFVCDLPAGHSGYHEGTVVGGTLRLGWPATEDRERVA